MGVLDLLRFGPNKDQTDEQKRDAYNAKTAGVADSARTNTIISDEYTPVKVGAEPKAGTKVVSGTSGAPVNLNGATFKPTVKPTVVDVQAGDAALRGAGVVAARNPSGVGVAGKTAINTGASGLDKPAAAAINTSQMEHLPVSVMSNRINRMQADNARETFLSKALEAISQKDGAIEVPKLDQMLTKAVDNSFKLPSTIARNAGGMARDTALPEGTSGPLALNTDAPLTLRSDFEKGQAERAITRGEDPTQFTGDTGRWSAEAADAFRKADPGNKLGLMYHPNPESLMNADGTLKPGAEAELKAIQVAESRAEERKKDELNMDRKNSGAFTEHFVGRRTGTIRTPDAGAMAANQTAFDAKWNPSADTQAKIEADAVKQNIQNVWQGDQNARTQALERELKTVDLKSKDSIARLVGLFGLSEAEIRANADRLNNQETNQTVRRGQDIVSKTEDKNRASQEGDPGRKATAAIQIDAATVDNDVLRNQARGRDGGAGDELYKRGLDAFTPTNLDKSDDPAEAEVSAISDIMNGIRGTVNANDKATRRAALEDKLKTDKRFRDAFDRFMALKKSTAIETKK